MVNRAGLLLRFVASLAAGVESGLVFSHNGAGRFGFEEIFRGLILVGVVALEEVLLLREILLHLLVVHVVVIVVHHAELIELVIELELLLLLLELRLIGVANWHGETSLGVSDVIEIVILVKVHIETLVVIVAIVVSI